MLYRAAQSEQLFGETYFAAHDEHLSVLSIAREIVRVFGRGRVTHVAWPEERQRIEIDRVRISSGRLRQLIDWCPTYPFEQGLRETLGVLQREQAV